MRLVSAILMLCACNPLPKVVTMKGEVRDAHGLGGVALAGADVAILDEEGASYASATTDRDGQFRVDAPAGAEIFAVVSSSVGPSSSFTGLSGLSPVYNIDDGELYAFSDAEVAAWRSTFEGCPNVSDQGTGALFGELRVREVTDPDTGEHPLVVSGRVELWNPRSDETHLPCYLDPEEGSVFDPSALYTGVSGSYAFVGVPEGIYVLSAVLELTPDELMWADQYVYVPKSGVVPRFPMWVSFPI